MVVSVRVIVVRGEEAVPTALDAGEPGPEPQSEPQPEPEYPTRQLAHRIGFRLGGEVGQGEYVLFPIRIPRPATGRVAMRIVCGECLAPVECTVFSAAHTARRRMRFLAYSGVSVGIAVAYCCFAGLFFSQAAGHATQEWKIVVIPLLGILLLPALGIMAWGLLTLFQEEDGVRIKSSRGHSLRKPGAVVDVK